MSIKAKQEVRAKQIEKEATSLLKQWYTRAPHSLDVTFDDYVAGVAYRYEQVTGKAISHDHVSIVKAVRNMKGSM